MKATKTQVSAAKAPKAARPAKAQRNRLSSVTTAIRLLKVFSESEAELGISALAQRLGVAKSTVHRLAVTLVSEGLLEQNRENERYRLGIGLFSLGALVRQRMDLPTEARQFLYNLREKTGETLLLAVPSEDEVMYIFNMESPQALRMRSDIGIHRPAHCTAVGLAILANSSPQMIDRVLAKPLAARTPKTVTDPTRVRTVLAQVQKQGYAIEDETSEPGIRCVAAPVFGSDGAISGALGIAGPSQRVSLDTLKGFVPDLLDAVRSISARLGHRSH